MTPTSRRAFIAGLTSALFADALSAPKGSSSPQGRVATDAYRKLFGSLVPPTANLVVHLSRLGLMVAVFEGDDLHPEYGPLENRYLCLAREAPGGFEVEVMYNVLGAAGHIEDTAVSIDDEGNVEVFEQALRWSSRQRWQPVGAGWDFGGMHYVNIGTGRPDEHIKSLEWCISSSRAQVDNEPLRLALRSDTVKNKPKSWRG